MARKPRQVAGVYEKNPGTGIWYIRYRVSGRLVRKRIEGRQQAINALDEVKYIKSSGSGVVPTSAKQPALTLEDQREIARANDEAALGITLGELCDLLQQHIVERHRQNPNKYLDQANPPQRSKVIKAALGHRPAARIRPDEIYNWFCKMEVSTATQNRYRGMLSTVYTFAKRKGLIEVNPVRDTEKQETDDGVIRWLTAAEEFRIRRVLQSAVDKCEYNQLILRQRALHRICEFDVALSTGMRRGEQYGLTWDQLDMDEGVIILERTKTLKGRRIYLNALATAAFRTLQGMSLHRKIRRVGEPNEAPHNVVFAKADNKKWWADVTREATVKNLRWHDLRHTFCSRLTHKGVNMKVIQDLAGHKSIMTTAKYAHSDEGSKRNAVALLDIFESRA
jgi:site-specific recombinase XerD